MPIIVCLPHKFTSHLLTCLLTFVASLSFAIAQEQSSLQQLDDQLEREMISRIEYINGVDEWVNQAFADGVNFPKDSLIALLANFREQVWHKDTPPGHRINYYIILSNNANYGNREGESVYFLEKAEQEIATLYGESPLLVAGRKCNTYIDHKHYGNVIATYLGVHDYLHSFPTLIRDEAINLNIAASFINVLHPTLLAYAALADTAKVNEVLQLATEIHQEIRPRIRPDSYITFTINFYLASMQQYRDFKMLDNRELSLHGLHAMQDVLESDTSQSAALIRQLKPVWLTRAVSHFLEYKQNDSANYYLAQLKANPAVFADHTYSIHRFESELLANQGNYRQAYEHLLQAMERRDSTQAILVNDIDELLYAHTDAEYNSAALIHSEQVKQQQLIAIFAILILSILTIAWIKVTARRKSLAARAQIDKLNTMADFHITAMEETKEQAAREEQKRLGRDLHDSLSSTLAGLKHQLSLLISAYPQPDLVSRLSTIRTHIDDAYTISRNKSHTWYHGQEATTEFSFKKRVKAMMDIALPDKYFEKEVLVDEDTLENTSIEMRIELLRIVHEAITNIIKHAKAHKVSVVLYREEDTLMLVVSDDGKGIKHTTTEGIGIQSMKDRTMNMGGLLRMEQRAQGTEVVASIPLAIM